MRVVVVACLLLTLALAGCASSGKDGKDSSSSTVTSSGSGSATKTGTKSSTATATGGTSGNATANRAPTGTMAVSGNGSVPLTVNVTLGGTDADGDALTWTLAFGDNATANGTALPATLLHNYTAAGTFAIEYRLSDGKNTTVYHANVTAVAGAAGGTPVTFTGTVVATDPLATVGGFCTADLFIGEGTAGNAGNWWAIEDAWIGWTYAIDPSSLLVTFFDGAGFPSGHGGTVPPAASEVVVCADGPVAAQDFTLTLSPA